MIDQWCAKLCSSGGTTSLDRRLTTPHVIKLVQHEQNWMLRWVYEVKFFDWRHRKKVRFWAQIGLTGPKYDSEKPFLGLWPKQPFYICSFWWHKKIGQKDLLWGWSSHPLKKSIRSSIGYWAYKKRNFFFVGSQALRCAYSHNLRFWSQL